MLCLGDSSQWSHLFPFRTEKLSTVEPMILLVGKVGSRQDRVFDFIIFKNADTTYTMWFFCVDKVFLNSHSQVCLRSENHPRILRV